MKLENIQEVIRQIDYWNRNKITIGFEITAGTVENWTQDCEPGTTGSRKAAAVWIETAEKERKT